MELGVCGNSGSGSPELMLAANNPKKRDGRKKFKETRHPTFRGVRRRIGGKWVCEIREPNKKTRIWLGTFPTPEMAARAHDVASIALRGTSSCLNYADSVWRLPLPVSGNMRDIQRAAAEAAEMFRPQFQPLPLLEEEIIEEEEIIVEENWMMDDDFFGMPDIVAEMFNAMMLPPPPPAPPPPAPPPNYDGDMVLDTYYLPLWS